MSVVIVDIFEEIVESMRSTGTITDIVISGGNSTITSVNTLSDGEVITIDSFDYVVISATPTEFVVSGEVSGSEWNAKAPYYLHGHPIEMVNTLLEKDEADTLKYQKYPLIYLVQDFDEDISNNGYYATIPDINIIILTNTSQDYTSSQRYSEVLKPILYPLFESFIQKVGEHVQLAPSIFDYTKTDRLFWGTRESMGNTANILNDPIDAIEINIKNLKVNSEIINIKC